MDTILISQLANSGPSSEEYQYFQIKVTFPTSGGNDKSRQQNYPSQDICTVYI
jgi:hypothetical protein